MLLPSLHDLVLQALSHTSSGKKIAAEQAGVAGKDRSFIKVDRPACAIGFNTQGTVGAAHELHVMFGSPDLPIATVLGRQQALRLRQ